MTAPVATRWGSSLSQPARPGGVVDTCENAAQLQLFGGISESRLAFALMLGVAGLTAENGHWCPRGAVVGVVSSSSTLATTIAIIALVECENGRRAAAVVGEYSGPATAVGAADGRSTLSAGSACIQSARQPSSAECENCYVKRRQASPLLALHPSMRLTALSNA